LIAAKIPNETPISSETESDVPISRSVAGKRSTIACTTVSEFDVE
jgi:hypothetical protein